jgi:hypothetical protein
VALALAGIPDHDRAAADAAPSMIALRDLPIPGGRRTVLRAVALAALTIGATALDWAGALGRRDARAETGPYGMYGWDRNDCRDAYPTGYTELGDTSGAYVNRPGACFGGSYRSSTYCDAGWHKHGTWYDGGVETEHVPVSAACGTIAKNSWRWTTPDGVVYRCSDGYTTYWSGPAAGQTYLTICRAPV